MIMLDGKTVRDASLGRLSAEAAAFDPRPKLVIVQVGDVPESNSYIRQKSLFGERAGFDVSRVRLPESATQEEIESKIGEANADGSVDGIILQLPLPARIDADACIEAISPGKDVDGLTAANLKLLWSGKPGFVPATAKGVIALLDHYGIPLEGRHAVIVGRSNLVGKPLALALLGRDATVTVCHRKTEDLPRHTSAADILIAAVGKPGIITVEHVRDGQTVVDVGITSVGEGEGRRLLGDVDFDAVKDAVGAITPVPGGVGPMTVLSLFENVLEARRRRAG